MLSNSNKYIANQPRIALESIDGETIIIDFETGLYYSARNEAYLVLEMILAGFSTDDIINFCTHHSKQSLQVIKPLVEAYLSLLLEAQIVIPATDIPSPTVKQEVDATLADHAIWSSGTFNPPVLESYKDMQEILLLDPIHDTNNKGWPEKK
jgi:hypothetical protein